MYPLHRSDTGSFQELAHASDVEFGQLSMLTIEPGCSRGGHYHTHKREWFCCIHGQCCLIIRNSEGKLIICITLTDSERKFVEVLPKEVHTLRNTSDTECELLIICNEKYDPKNPDTLKCESVLKEIEGESIYA
jgi:UDP-2-acetamido-2,6-beta-L-arabino-hexul-4-ose reductase